MRDTISLGYEMGTGHSMWVPIGHTAVTGQTQLSGKTTTLEALAMRSNRKVIAFRTKRAESAFTTGERIPPYFSERADWQFVAAILEATLRERLKFERAWIMRACKGAHTLADVHKNVKTAMIKAKGLSADVYMTLDNYLDLVVPQIESLPMFHAGEPPNLHLGLNVMDLADFSTEMQSLIIRSVLDWVYRSQEHVITVIPEAWEFIPQNRGSPVLLAAENLIRKGAASRNYVWLDSQDIAAVHKNVLRSVSVWLLGVQREHNEIKRMLAHIPRPRPTVEDVMSLGRGEFFSCTGTAATRVYVQPIWCEASAARAYSLKGVEMPSPPERTEEDDMGLHDELQRARDDSARKDKQIEALKRDIANLEDRLSVALSAPRPKAESMGERHPTAMEIGEGPNRKRVEFGNGNFPLDGVGFNDLYDALVSRLRDDTAILKLALTKPELQVSVTVKTIEVDGETIDGKVAKLMSEGFFNEPKSANAAMVELRKRGHSHDPRSMLRTCDKMASLGFLRKESLGFLMVPEMSVNIVEK